MLCRSHEDWRKVLWLLLLLLLSRRRTFPVLIRQLCLNFLPS